MPVPEDLVQLERRLEAEWQSAILRARPSLHGSRIRTGPRPWLASNPWHHHRDPSMTVRYTRIAGRRFEGLWR